MASFDLLAAAAWPWSGTGLVGAIVALAAAWLLHVTILVRSDGDEESRARTAVERAQALALLARVARGAAGCGLVGFVLLLSFADSSEARFCAWGFLAGAAFALFAGAIAWWMAHETGARAAEAARTSPSDAIATAAAGASVTGLAAAGLALLGVGVLWLLARDPAPLFGLALGAALITFCVRVGGGSAGSPAAAGAELFAAHVVAVVAAMALCASAGREAGLEGAALAGLVALPLALAGCGAVAAISRRFAVPLFAILAFVLLLFVDRAPLARWGEAAGRPAWGSLLGLVAAPFAGLFAGLAAGRITGHFESGAPRTALPVVLIAAAALVAFAGAGRLGLGLAAIGASAALRIAPSTPFGPALAPPALVEAERGAAATGCGIVAVAAALAALALFTLFRESARVGGFDLGDPDVAAGLLVGAMVPFALTSRFAPIGRAKTSTAPRLRAMIGLGLIVVVAPLALGRLNPMALGGVLAGALACGVLLLLVASDAALAVLIQLMSLVAIVAARR